MLIRFLRSMIIAVTALVATTAVQAAPIIGGTTYLRIDIGPAFIGAGGTIDPVGTASYAGQFDGDPVYALPITGGSTTPPVTVDHLGSGVAFGFDGNTLTLSNFVIDATTLTIFGDVMFDADTFTDQALFSIDVTSDPNFPLLLSTTTVSAAAFSSLLGEDVPVGVQVAAAGLVGVETGAVPEPGTWLLMIGGFGLVGVAVRRWRRQALSLA